MDAALTFAVIGSVTTAILLDLVVAISWLRRVLAMWMERSNG
jgi:hypothetical protein